jgi:hypothetical protein
MTMVISKGQTNPFQIEGYSIPQLSRRDRFPRRCEVIESISFAEAFFLFRPEGLAIGGLTACDGRGRSEGLVIGELIRLVCELESEKGLIEGGQRACNEVASV